MCCTSTEAPVNLFSTRQATNSGAVITFMNNGCSVSLDGTLYMEGISQEDGLLVINQSKEQPASAVAAAAVSKDTAELWHRRFGHLGYDNLFNLKKRTWWKASQCQLSTSCSRRRSQLVKSALQQSSPGYHSLSPRLRPQGRWSLSTWTCADQWQFPHMVEQSTWQPLWMTIQGCPMWCHWCTSQR